MSHSSIALFERTYVYSPVLVGLESLVNVGHNSHDNMTSSLPTLWCAVRVCLSEYCSKRWSPRDVALACMADFIEVARLFKWETNVSCVNLTKLMGNLVTILTAFGTLSLCCDQ